MHQSSCSWVSSLVVGESLQEGEWGLAAAEVLDVGAGRGGGQRLCLNSGSASFEGHI